MHRIVRSTTRTKIRSSESDDTMRVSDDTMRVSQNCQPLVVTSEENLPPCYGLAAVSDKHALNPNSAIPGLAVKHNKIDTDTTCMLGAAFGKSISN